MSAWSREGLPAEGTPKLKSAKALKKSNQAPKLKSAKALKKSNQVINGVMNAYL